MTNPIRFLMNDEDRQVDLDPTPTIKREVQSRWYLLSRKGSIQETGTMWVFGVVYTVSQTSDCERKDLNQENCFTKGS